MDKFWWRLAWGLCLSQLSLAQIDLNITCRYAGVFHVEKNGRYSISKTEAADLCKAFNSTLPTMTEMEAALSIGFETCRYGFIEGHVVIPRIHPNSICAANNTGVYILTSNTSQYDTYCFNASAPPGEDCTSVTHLPNAFEGPITITIVNRDGTRYTQTGEYRTNPEDIYPSNPTDDDVSSGSSSERSTSGGYSIFHTHLPTAYPTQDQDSPGASDNPENPPITITSTVHSNSHAAVQEQTNWMWSWLGNSQPKTQDHTTAATTGTDSNIISAGWEPTEENEDERDKHPSYSGSGIDDDEDFISSTISTTPRLFNHPKQNQDRTQWSPGESNPGVLLQTTARMTDVDRSSTIANGESWTREPHSPLIHHERHDEEETQHSTSPTPAHDSHPDQRMTTQSQEDNSWTYFFDPISHPMGRGHQTERWMEDQDSPVHPSGRSHTTHGSESAGHTSGSQEGGPNTTSGPTRKPQIPEWLIILASLLALALILAVCIAVNSRRRCGQKKKLVINNGNGAVEERKASGLNGEASKSQEMVHLVNKESSVTCDQYMTADETRNLQNVDMKIGV
ncbi:CD44 antigen isoform X14 [Prionailurus bengalensis]|uniref:CD44 antigen isoform X14 n=1 Tax=Prionailurus bengalensis TaxID=37029 RepID=UPI001CA7DA6A|nr:CD44 antigen isoform X14 [Prionailurus bengalensis]